MKNVGNMDRGIRFIVGAFLVTAPFLMGWAMFDASISKWGSVVVGLVLLATSALKFCPLYRIFGLRTCRLDA